MLLFYKLVVTNLFYIITADSILIAILYEYLWQKSLPFGKSKIPLVNKLINPLVRVISQKNFRRGEKHDKQKTYEKIAPVVMSAAVAMTSMPYAVLASDFTDSEVLTDSTDFSVSEEFAAEDAQEEFTTEDVQDAFAAEAQQGEAYVRYEYSIR